MARSVLFHVQHLLGIGHLQRSRRIAEALARHGALVTLVNGGTPISGLTDPATNLRVVQLPPVRALDARFELIDGAGRPIDDDLRDARRSALVDAFAAARPDAVVIEGYPFARRAFRFELDPLIAAARAAGVRLICSVRDIVNLRDDPARHAEIAARIRADFDRVLVHGDPALVPFEASFAATDRISDRLVYTGYVYEPKVMAATNGPVGEVLVSGGGGPAGLALLATAIEARRLGCLADSPWLLLTGVNLPEAQFDALAGMAPPGLAIDRFRPDFPALLRTCRVSVSQAGYNTVLDLLAAGARAVLVPFAAERETEQSRRAERLAELGAAELVPEAELSPRRLAMAIERAASRRPTTPAVDIGGAERAAKLILGEADDAADAFPRFMPADRGAMIGQ